LLSQQRIRRLASEARMILILEYIHMIIHVCVSLYIYTYIWPTHLQAIAFLIAKWC
jgi:hypothetical protein